jgi:lipopolysaccharide export system permease protein
VIKADHGVLESAETSSVLSLVLYNGNYYDEVSTKTYQQKLKAPFVKSAFDKYVLNIDLSGFNDVDLDDESLKHPYKMLNTSELRIQLDSFSIDYIKGRERLNRLINQRSGLQRTLNYTIELDSSSKRKINQTIADRINSDSAISADQKKDSQHTIYKDFSIDSLFWEYPYRQRSQIFNVATNSVNSITPQIISKKNQFKQKEILLNKIEMAMHSKYALPFACIILFFVGAPLGAIIRKGGLGLPMVIAIIVFLTYHFIGLFAGNSAEGGSLSPFLGSWLSTIILFPLSIYLTYRATTDQGFVNLDSIAVPLDKMVKHIKSKVFNIRKK